MEQIKKVFQYTNYKGTEFEGTLMSEKTVITDYITCLEIDSEGTKYWMNYILFPKGVGLGHGFGYISDPCMLVMCDLTKRSYLFRVYGYLSIDYYYEKIFGRNAWQSLENPDVAVTHHITRIMQDRYKKQLEGVIEDW